MLCGGGRVVGADCGPTMDRVSNVRRHKLARPGGIEPPTAEVITLGTLPLSYGRIAFHRSSGYFERQLFNRFRSIGSTPSAIACPAYGASASITRWRGNPCASSAAASARSSASFGTVRATANVLSGRFQERTDRRRG